MFIELSLQQVIKRTGKLGREKEAGVQMFIIVFTDKIMTITIW